ncbi:hypothetical protein FLP10_04870 [Agromyces intestinalis]|uniref:Uncharacterized protein n=1 Tax=Agromyces intestinalis TaxID=2592652 RepID=A0A5C1YDV3_9MICO|nr:DUF6069 family protein [Agromyces intestinalis]QEO13828.1 hypothetical protein FLP10_04870 [Agromyces intestinalis]
MDEMTISHDLPTRADASSPRRRRLGRLATIGVAAVLALVVWAIAVPVAGVALTVGTGAAAQTVTPASVAFAVLVPGFAAWGVLALLERFARHARRVFAIIGWSLLALSLLGPVLTGAGGAVLAVLLVMHVVTGATLMIGLPLAAWPGRGVATGRE